MKKSLIALAALAATGAFAQSSVTLTGSFDPSIVAEKRTYGNGADVSQTLVSNSRQGTSAIIFKGVEDLGGGMSALFLYEADFSAALQANGTTTAVLQQDGTTATTLPSNTAIPNTLGALGGEVFTGLSGSMGTFKIGAPNMPTLAVQGGRGQIGTKLGSGFNSVLGTSHVRESNSFVYDSPVVLGGLQVRVGRAFGTAGDPNSIAATTSATGNIAGYTPAQTVADVGAKTDVSITYAAGPIRTGISRWMADSYSTTSNTQTNLFTQYDLGAHTLYIGAHNETSTKNVQTSSYNVGARVNVAAGTNLIFNYGKLTDLTNSGTAAKDRSILALGAKYDLSKRTSLYARYVAEKNDNVAGVDIGTGASAKVAELISTLVGIQHNF
jgi:predicted porin